MRRRAAEGIRFLSIRCLEILVPCTEMSLEWLSLVEATARRSPSGRGAHAPSDRGLDQKLTVLASWAVAPVNAAFMTPIM